MSDVDEARVASTTFSLPSVEELQKRIFQASTPDEIDRLKKLLDVRIITAEHQIKLDDTAGSAKRDWWKVALTLFGIVITALQAYNTVQTSQANQSAKLNTQLQIAQPGTQLMLKTDPAAADRVQSFVQQDTHLASDFLGAVPPNDSLRRADAIVTASGKTAIFIHASRRDEQDALSLEADLRRSGYISWVDWAPDEDIGQSRLDYFRNNSPEEAIDMRKTIEKAGGFEKPLALKPHPAINNAKNTYGLWIKSFGDLKGPASGQK